MILRLRENESAAEVAGSCRNRLARPCFLDRFDGIGEIYRRAGRKRPVPRHRKDMRVGDGRLPEDGKISQGLVNVVLSVRQVLDGQIWAAEVGDLWGPRRNRLKVGTPKSRLASRLKCAC